MAVCGSILVVDDEAQFVTLLAQALRAEGHEVVETSTGVEARRRLGDRPLDVVVDYRRPGMSDLDLMRELAQSRRTP
jgi:CheY-like chemotaxis protein